MITFDSDCISCKYFNDDGFYCPAYPDGIPNELLAGKITHREIIKEQTGKTIFELDKSLQNDF